MSCYWFIFFVVLLGKIREIDAARSPEGGRSTKATVKTGWEPIANSRKVTGSGPSEISTSRRACGFYVWNFVSASMYHLCQYLMKDAVFEGKGGRKFVRIKPGSILELLYPASRHSPDKCIFCGGSYPDHMTLWWSRHIYSPYDLYMDRTYAEGVLQRVAIQTNSQGRTRPVPVSTGRDNDEPTRRHVFHARYVHDLSLILQGATKPKEIARRLTRLIDDDPYLGNLGEMKERRYLNTTYVVPSIGTSRNPLLKFARQRVLDAVEVLISIEETDDALLGTKPTTR